MASAIDWTRVAGQAASYIYDLHQWNNAQTVEICGRQCNVQIKVRLHKLKWVWDGRCECGGIVGSDRHNKNQTEAIRNAIQDYVMKAGQAGLITPEQVEQYKQ